MKGKNTKQFLIVTSLNVYVGMDHNRIGLRQSLKLFSLLLICIILPIYLATERCPTCLDGECKGSGECTKGCIDGFADKYCEEKCQPTCKDAKCQLDKKTGKIICLSGCEDGYCGKQCKAPCVDGCSNCDNRTCTCSRCNGSFYGDKCQHSCMDGCLLCYNKGQCLSCKDGLHGINCDHTCGSECIRCKRETGKCIKCRQGFHGDSCDQVSTDASDWNSQLIVLIAILIVVTVVMNIVILGLVIPIHVSGFRAKMNGRCTDPIPLDEYYLVDGVSLSDQPQHNDN